MKPLVSILIPAYNSEDWIGDTIKSAVAQTWPRKEIIVVDDGSRDATLAIARSFSSAQVSVVTQQNGGASAARNKALELCQGDYIQWLDADDLLAPDKVEKQMEIAQQCCNPRTLFSSAWAHFFYRTKQAEFIPTELWSDLSPVEWLTRKMAHNRHMQTATWLVSRELTEAAGPWDIRLWKDNDGEYFCRVVMKSEAIRFVPEARTYYRRSSADSVTNIGRSNKKLDSQFHSLQLHTGYLLSMQNNPATREACANYLQTWFHNFYPQRPDLVEGLRKLASELGRELHTPRLSWKYTWIQKIFGWKAAKELQLLARNQKENAMRFWDKLLFYLESRAGSVGQVISQPNHLSTNC